MSLFELNKVFPPSLDQSRAIKALVENLQKDVRDQVLLGVTGSGKTFTMANVIADMGKPALIMAHNKTLAAQLYEEMRCFFPKNSVEYFVSYYDYYQPEAYIAHRDIYIEKDSAINENIDRLRHSATRALLERRDVIVISSVSCIYGLGEPELYLQMSFSISVGDKIDLNTMQKKLIELHYQRNDVALKRGFFQSLGDTLIIFPSHYENYAWKLSFFGDDLESIEEFNVIDGKYRDKLAKITIFANSHYVAPLTTIKQALKLIKQELQERVAYFNHNNMLLEAKRVAQRTNLDLELIFETGTCKGIENYSRYFSGRAKGEPPPTLFEYLPDDSLLFIDESHVTVPQTRGMFNGDRARKNILVQHGFRLESALDNRPLTFAEWNAMRPQTVYVSATPCEYEIECAKGVIIEQLIRPTGLVDPECVIRPVANQVEDLIGECLQVIKNGDRVLVTAITKKMAEHLAEYMVEAGISTSYLHSDVKTLERIEIIRDLRLGKFDVLIGVNLLREGLDIPECGLVAILDADKEGFLRSQTSLIQTIGRAARNINGRVILYADSITKSIKGALCETDRRREVQIAHNKALNITPKTITKSVRSEHMLVTSGKRLKEKALSDEFLDANIADLKKQMHEAAKNLDFELASKIRDHINASNN